MKLVPISVTLATIALVCSSCSSVPTIGKDPYSGASYQKSPHILNVSSYDPKERQRSGDSFSVDHLAALRKNGALGLIARISKGSAPDTKCARFLKAADREGLLLGAYHFVLPGIDVERQADSFVERVRATGTSNRLSRPILMVGDFDSKIPARDIARFITRVEERTGKVPIVYLENADPIKTSLRNADQATKAALRRAPYWMALYGHVDKMDSIYSVRDRTLTPEVLLDIYDVWDEWALWQYGGVWWDRRHARSAAHHYHHGAFRSPEYFGRLDRPTERNVFNGSTADLYAFWEKHAWDWRR